MAAARAVPAWLWHHCRIPTRQPSWLEFFADASSHRTCCRSRLVVGVGRQHPGRAAGDGGHAVLVGAGQLQQASDDTGYTAPTGALLAGHRGVDAHRAVGTLDARQSGVHAQSENAPAARGLHCGIRLVRGLGGSALAAGRGQRLPDDWLALHAATGRLAAWREAALVALARRGSRVCWRADHSAPWRRRAAVGRAGSLAGCLDGSHAGRGAQEIFGQ